MKIRLGKHLVAGSSTPGLRPGRWKVQARSRHKPVDLQDAGEALLKPRHGSIGKVLGALLVACFWNGIVGVFVWQLVESVREGRTDWFLLLFLLPFVAVGLFLVVMVFYYLLALANPRFNLVLSEGRPRLGETVNLKWEGSGSLSRLDTLTFLLEGRESATYRSGKNTRTDRSLFCQQVIHETSQLGPLANGRISFTVPAGAMHSFDGGSNRIEWCLRVKGSIRRWPDVDESYPITIRPIRLT